MLCFSHMRTFFVSYVSCLASLAVLDGIWLTLIAKPFYARSLAHLLSPTVRWVPVVLFYLIYAAGISLLVVLPQLKQGHSALMTLAFAALLGFIAYAAYDFTNLATLNKWPVLMSIVDMAWGTAMTGAAGLTAFLVVRRFGA